MAVKPRKSELKKFMPVLEADYDSDEQAATAILTKAYELYEGQAKWYVVGQVRPNTGWRSPEEGRDAKVLLGPFGTRRQAEEAGTKLAYSHSTGEQASWWAVEAWYQSPAAWYIKRAEQWKREGFLDMPPLQARQALRDQWFKDHDGAPLPPSLEGHGWEGLEAFQIWRENTDGEPDEYDLKAVIDRLQEQVSNLTGRSQVAGEVSDKQLA